MRALKKLINDRKSISKSVSSLDKTVRDLNTTISGLEYQRLNFQKKAEVIDKKIRNLFEDDMIFLIRMINMWMNRDYYLPQLSSNAIKHWKIFTIDKRLDPIRINIQFVTSYREKNKYNIEQTIIKILRRKAIAEEIEKLESKHRVKFRFSRKLSNVLPSS